MEEQEACRGESSTVCASDILDTGILISGNLTKTSFLSVFRHTSPRPVVALCSLTDVPPRSMCSALTSGPGLEPFDPTQSDMQSPDFPFSLNACVHVKAA